MEFPHLGKQCGNKECKQLDFLPMKCDACSQIFCNEHIHYNTHSCTESYKKDNQVPVCPLCNKLIPVKKEEMVDVVVGQHIDSDCQSDPAKERRKVYTNKCSKKGCKVKEMIPVRCEKCRLNYCLKHRFEDDHNCQGFQGSGQSISQPGAAAVSRIRTNSTANNKPATQNRNTASQPKSAPSQNPNFWKDLDRERRERQERSSQHMSAAQAGLSNEEALARAIQESLRDSQTSQSAPTASRPLTQEEEDLLLAQALSASEEEARRQSNRQSQQTQGQDKKSCHVS